MDPCFCAAVVEGFTHAATVQSAGPMHSNSRLLRKKKPRTRCLIEQDTHLLIVLRSAIPGMQLASHSIASILEPNHPSHRTAWLVTGGTAYRAVLHPIATSSETSGGGIVSLYVAPGNASITYDVSVGGFQAGTEIFNVSVVFENIARCGALASTCCPESPCQGSSDVCICCQLQQSTV